MSNLAQIKAEQSKAVEMARAHVEAYSQTYTPEPAVQKWLGDAQPQLLDSFLEAGFPTTRPEKWRFTNLAGLGRKAFSAPQKRPINSAIVGEAKLVKGATTLVFVDGVLHHDLSEMAHLPTGVRVAPLSQATSLLTPEQAKIVRQHDEPLEALNAGFLTDGVMIDVEKNATPNTPIELLYISSGEGEATHTRTFINLAESAELQVYESFASASKASGNWLNNVSHVTLGRNSKLKFARSQNLDRADYFTSSVHTTIARDATFDAFTSNMGCKQARTHFTSHVLEGGAHLEVNGFSLTGLGQHHNITTTTHHTVANTTANQCVRNVVAGNGQRGGHAVFLGQYLVAADALQTDAEMLNQNLLLGDKAKADYKPELEIFADDVKCSHGATTGRLDEEQLFYLRQRGLTELEAKSLLTEAFVASIIDSIGNEQAEEKLKTETRNWLKNQEDA